MNFSIRSKSDPSGFRPISLPHPVFFRAILVRATLIWVVGRASLLMVGLTVPALVVALLIVALTAWLTILDGRRTGESLLLANLGIPEFVLTLIAAVPPFVCELVIQLLA